MVRRRGGLRAVLRERGDGLALVLADRRVDVPARAGDALARLLSGDDVAAGDLPGLDAEDAVALVRRLLREGVVVPASAGPRRGLCRTCRRCRTDGRVTAARRPPRCSDGAVDRGDPRAGSAVARQPLVPRRAARARGAGTRCCSRGSTPAVAAEVSRRAAAAGARVLLVRRHGRAGHTTHHRRHWALVDSRPGVRGRRLGPVRARRGAARRACSTAPWSRPRTRARGDPSRPVYLACAHGRHDTCCAVKGREVAAALDDLGPRPGLGVLARRRLPVRGQRRRAAARPVLRRRDPGARPPRWSRRPRPATSCRTCCGAARRCRRRSRPPSTTPGPPGPRSAWPSAPCAREGTTAQDDGSVTVDLAVRATGQVLAVRSSSARTPAAALLTCAASAPGDPDGLGARAPVVDRPGLTRLSRRRPAR